MFVVPKWLFRNAPIWSMGTGLRIRNGVETYYEMCFNSDFIVNLQ